MKATKMVIVSSVVAGIFAMQPTYAFNLSSPLGGSSSSGATDNMAAQDALVKSFVASQIEVFKAQSLLAQAYGLKDQAKLCDDQANTLQSTSVDSDTLKKTVDLSNNAMDQISDQQKKQASLTDEEKRFYVQSLPHFALGVIGTHDVVEKAATFTSGVKNSGSSVGGLLSMGTSKLASGMFIAKATPSYSKNLFDVFRKTVTIGENSGVKAPADVTSALGSLD